MIAKITIGKENLAKRAKAMGVEVDWDGTGDEFFDVYTTPQADGSLSVLGNTLVGQLFLSVLRVGG